MIDLGDFNDFLSYLFMKLNSIVNIIYIGIKLGASLNSWALVTITPQDLGPWVKDMTVLS